VCVCVHSVCSVVYTCVLKQLLFEEILTVIPCHKPKLHWRDVIVRDVQRFGLDAHNWYGVAQDRPRWYELCESLKCS